jgi:hypothetical protein
VVVYQEDEKGNEEEAVILLQTIKQLEDECTSLKNDLEEAHDVIREQKTVSHHHEDEMKD